MRYEQVEDGEWITPRFRRGHKLQCCDCGLVHVMNFRVRKGRLQYQANRDEPASRGIRRRRGIKITAHSARSSKGD